jgi:hypothetical protein
MPPYTIFHNQHNAYRTEFHFTEKPWTDYLLKQNRGGMPPQDYQIKVSHGKESNPHSISIHFPGRWYDIRVNGKPGSIDILPVDFDSEGIYVIIIIDQDIL